MLTLYHADTAVCAAKVRLTLAEKALPWQGELLNLGRGDQFKPEYLALNGHGVVPTLVHDGLVITESTIINEYLDETFPEAPLRPAAAFDRARMRLWTKREDAIHDAINTATVVLYFRPELLLKSPDERARRYDKIPNPSRRDKWRDLLDQGIASVHVQDALLRFAQLFADMETTLDLRGPWLLGDQISLADLGLLSFFYRLELLQCSAMWRKSFPNVARWFEASKTRASFDTAITQYIPQARADHFASVCSPLETAMSEQFRSTLPLIVRHA